MGAPPLEQVLANVVPGRGRRLRLSGKQRRGLDDRDGRIALKVIRALVRAREATGHRVCETTYSPGNNRPFYLGRNRPFPLTEDAFQAIAARLGHRVGDKRARAIIKRCVALGVLVDAGSYRQDYRRSGAGSGFRVADGGAAERLGGDAGAARLVELEEE